MLHDLEHSTDAVNVLEDTITTDTMDVPEETITTDTMDVLQKTVTVITSEILGTVEEWTELPQNQSGDY